MSINEIFANDISNYFSKYLEGRAKLPVLVRKLIHETGKQIIQSDFPGNDDSQRHGWDGVLYTGTGTAWIPEGKSVWEFGVNQSQTSKANRDIDGKRVKKKISEDEKSEITFVFVTPQRWSTKNNWIKEKKESEGWKDVRAYDSSDLEQWLEQAPATNAWFCSLIGKYDGGTLSLEEALKQWIGEDSCFTSSELFRGMIEENRDKIQDFFEKDKIEKLTIKASTAELAEAFLYHVLSSPSLNLKKYLDSVYVTNNIKVINNSNIIPFISSLETQKQLPSVDRRKAILFEPKCTPNNIDDCNADKNNILSIEIPNRLNRSLFRSGLKALGFNENEITKYDYLTGRDLLTLREIRSNNTGIKLPDWLRDIESKKLILSFAFIGLVNIENNDEIALVSKLSGVDAKIIPEKLKEISEKYNDSVIWIRDKTCGITSKLYVLNLCYKSISTRCLKNFMAISEPVLREYCLGNEGKLQKYQPHISKSIFETLEIISGSSLQREEFNREIRNFVDNLLKAFKSGKKEISFKNLTKIAKIAPESFLEIFEEFVFSGRSSLVNPNIRNEITYDTLIGIIDGLACLAWKREYFLRTIRLLSAIYANHHDIAIEFRLKNIFQCTYPQTEVSRQELLGGIKYICKQHSNLAFYLCIETIKNIPQHGNEKPEYWDIQDPMDGERNFGIENKYKNYMGDILFNYDSYSTSMIKDLIDVMDNFSLERKERVIEIVEEWGKRESDEISKAEIYFILCSKFTTELLNSMAKNGENQLSNAVKSLVKNLKPKDIIARHLYLFYPKLSTDYLNCSLYEHIDDLIKLRENAIEDIYLRKGVDGIFNLIQFTDVVYVDLIANVTSHLCNENSLECLTLKILKNKSIDSKYSGFLKCLLQWMHNRSDKDFLALEAYMWKKNLIENS